MMRRQIILPTTFIERHRRAVEKYIQDARLMPAGSLLIFWRACCN
jgi:hypothetical protein